MPDTVQVDPKILHGTLPHYLAVSAEEADQQNTRPCDESSRTKSLSLHFYPMWSLVSIMDLQSVSYPNGKLTISKWIDAFPFPDYIVLRDLATLPQVLSDALRQWRELLQRT